MSGRAHLALYRRFSACYPRPFREEYGEDLATTFALQLAEHGAIRCWLRTARDLIVTIPTQHLEPRMNRPSSPVVAATCLALAIGATLAALTTGTGMYGAAMLLVAVVAVAGAVLVRRAAKPALALEGSGRWKMFLAIGSVLLAAIVVAINLPANRNQELSARGWSVMALSMLLSFTLIGAGVVLGAARLVHNRQG